MLFNLIYIIFFRWALRKLRPNTLSPLCPVLAAVEMMNITQPEIIYWKLCNQITPQVRSKWVETNPLLILIKDESISKKLYKSYETALLINQNKSKVKAKNIFIDKIDHLFEILVCQCPINLCELADCNTAQCKGWAVALPL